VGGEVESLPIKFGHPGPGLSTALESSVSPSRYRRLCYCPPPRGRPLYAVNRFPRPFPFTTNEITGNGYGGLPHAHHMTFHFN